MPLCKDTSKEGVADWASDQAKLQRALGSYVFNRQRRNKGTRKNLTNLMILKDIVRQARTSQEDSQAMFSFNLDLCLACDLHLLASLN